MTAHTEPINILYVCANPAADIIDEVKEIYTIHHFTEPLEAFSTLYDNQYSIIILEMAVFEDADDLRQAVSELRRRFPFSTILTLVQKVDDVQADLFDKGVDDILTYDMDAENWLNLFSPLVKQQRQKINLHNRNQRLQTISQLSEQLYFAEDPRNLVRQTIETACKALNLYGLVILLDEGEQTILYAGQQGPATIYETVIHLDQYHPLQRTMDLGAGQVYQDITLDGFYEPIPILPEAASAIVLSLRHRDMTTGAMAVFNQPGAVFTNDDLVVYEMFASHFASALNSVRHQHAQTIDFEFSQYLLRAWQVFSRTYSLESIAKALCELGQGIPIVGQVMVWFYQLGQGGPEIIVYGDDDDVLEEFKRLDDEGHINRLLETIDEQLYLQLRPRRQTEITNLARLMQGTEIMIFPVVDSTRLAGGMILAPAGNYRFNVDNVNLIRGLTNIAGQSAERTMLIEIMQEKSGQLEAILRGVSEGIFFVDSSRTIAFCNTQFTELTGINRSEVLGKEPLFMLRQIAGITDLPERTLPALESALSQVNTSDDGMGDYPIVEIVPSGEQGSLYVEFAILEGMSSGGEWAGFVRATASNPGTQSGPLMTAVADYLRQPYATLDNLLQNLDQNHAQLKAPELTEMIADSRREFDDIWSVWENFNVLAHGEITPETDATDNLLHDMIEAAINNPALSDYRNRLVINLPQILPPVATDRTRTQQMLRYLLQSALMMASAASSVAVEASYHDQEAIVSLQFESDQTPDQFNTLLNVPYDSINEAMSAPYIPMGLYLSANAIRIQGGHIHADYDSSGQMRLIASLPAIAIQPEAVTQTTTTPPVEGMRAPTRSMRTVMLVRGDSELAEIAEEQLDQEEVDVIVYENGADALRDLSLIRIDLILIDAHLPDMDGINLCKRIRKETEIPIMMVGDNISTSERLKGLKIGADDYISQPMETEEITVRIRNIFNRQMLADRTREPLDLGELTIDFARRQVFLKGKPIVLTRIEYELLRVLAINMGQVLTHEQILKQVWGPEYQAEKQYLWVNISRLRKKLEPSGGQQRYIYNESGVGYIFTAL